MGQPGVTGRPPKCSARWTWRGREAATGSRWCRQVSRKTEGQARGARVAGSERQQRWHSIRPPGADAWPRAAPRRRPAPSLRVQAGERAQI